MKRKTIIYAALSIVLAAYVCVAVSLSRKARAADTFTKLEIVVADSAHSGFITAADIDIDLGDLSTRITKTRRSQLNTLHIENQLRARDNIENAHVTAMGNGVLRITVTPMQPVARVFDNSGSSYYINRSGKRIGASARYHADVPIVSGNIRNTAQVAALLPMFEVIKSNPEFDALVTQVDIADNGDIIVIPSVAGHVINLGDTSNIADKMQRLRTFYHNVVAVRGWEYYDTLSVKWNGRLVATRATKTPVDNRPLTELDGIVNDVPDLGTTESPDSDPHPDDKTKKNL